jgi:hypothetical protein
MINRVMDESEFYTGKYNKLIKFTIKYLKDWQKKIIHEDLSSKRGNDKFNYYFDLINQNKFDDALTFLNVNKETLIKDKYTQSDWLHDILFCLVNLNNFDISTSYVEEIIKSGDAPDNALFDGIMYYLDRYCIKYKILLNNRRFDAIVKYLITINEDSRKSYLISSYFIALCKDKTAVEDDVIKYFDTIIQPNLSKIKLTHPRLVSLMYLAVKTSTFTLGNKNKLLKYL